MVGVDSLLLGRYRLGETLAVGGMGTVFTATDEKLGRKVAIKILADNLARDESFVERFRREARAAAGLTHPNVASVYDYGEENGCHFIVMELVEGRDLSQILRSEGPMAAERTVAIVAQICAALAHAHSAGIIHRDVKPANIIISEGDRVKVTDFGIARAAGDSKLTLTGSVLGTAQYISPEQANGAALTHRSDIYSLGIVVYECLTGALPFTGSSPMAVAMRHVNDDVPPPSEIDRSIPDGLDGVVDRATRKDPKERFGDATEMAAALGASIGTATGADTAVVAGPATDRITEHSVWPIPGDHWDPTSLGRKVLIVFAALAAIALALLVWRIASSDVPRARAERDTGATVGTESTPETQADNQTVPESVIGMDIGEVEAIFEENGVRYTTQPYGGEELEKILERFDISAEVAGPGEVFATDPTLDDALASGETITLFVSEGFGDEGSEDDDERGPPDHAKKDKEKDDD